MSSSARTYKQHNRMTGIEQEQNILNKSNYLVKHNQKIISSATIIQVVINK